MSVTLAQVRANQNRKVTITTTKALRVRKDAAAVVKHTQYQVEIGSDLNTLDLPWGTWVEPGLVIAHKDQLYVRCTRVEDANAEVYFTDAEGNWIDRAQAQEQALAIEFPDYSKPASPGAVMSICLNNITEIA